MAPPRLHGAGDNPANRFERLRYLEDPEYAEFCHADPEEAAAPVAVRYYDDPSRTLLATNRSPDVPFDVSLNPYRGCLHGCIYCLTPNTPVLHSDMGWRPIGEIRVGDELLGFDEYPEPRRNRKLRPARVEAVWWSRQPSVRIVTQNTEVHTTADHRWLQAGSFRWSMTRQLEPGRFLRHLPVEPLEPEDVHYRIGYVVGMSLGDGTFRYQPGWRSDKKGFPAAYWRVALIDLEPLFRLVGFLGTLGVDTAIRPFDPGRGYRRRMWKVETRSLSKLAIVNRILNHEPKSRSYRRGFVAGFFDAEGHNGTSLRISQVDLGLLDRVRGYAEALGFEFQLERRSGRASTIRLVGTIADRIRFFGVCRPAIRRKLDALFGCTPPTRPERIEAIEKGPRRSVVDIQTSSGTFYAAGLPTHNCFARPTHEYLGFSAGLDFETRILVKRNAPELLREALAAPRWRPRVVGLGAVTDAYQPVERRLELTRRCLEVFAEFRNPVSIVTKGALVVRDADLLADLAAHRAAAVFVSLTSLDPDLARRMEPGAAPPARRLAAIRELADAGVPVGVMIAPVIPALNEHEVPALVEAAARAGAATVKHIMLRLPHGLGPLFEAWLERHFPERKAKVLGRIRAMRGGRLNDPRFGERMRGQGLFAEQTRALFELARRRAGLPEAGPELSSAAFRRAGQLSLWGSPPGSVP